MIEYLGIGEVLTSPRQPLAPGVRAALGTVGYLGSMGGLTVLNPGDPTPTGTIWDTGALVVVQDDVHLDSYHIMGSVFVDGHDGCVVSNCVVEPAPPPDGIVGIHLNGTGTGLLTVTDTTVIGHPDLDTSTPQASGISSDDGLIARRCDVSATGDGIHWFTRGGNLISQCCVHDLAFINEEQHCDGMQAFEGDEGATFTVEHCYVAPILSTIGTPGNSGATCGQSSDNAIGLTTAVYNNNFLGNGAYRLRINWRMTGVVVTNNDVGPLDLDAGEFGLIDVAEPSSIATWSGNRDANGDLIPQP